MSAVPIDARVYVYRTPSGRKVLMASMGNPMNKSIGRATGRAVRSEDGSKWLEITLHNAVKGETTGWMRFGDNITREVLLYKPVEGDHNALINGDLLVKRLAATDQMISKELLKAQAIISQTANAELKQQALPVLQNLSAKLNSRQQKIKTSKLVQFEEKLSEGMRKVLDYIGLSGLHDQQLGAIPLVPIAVGGVVGVGAAVALYYVFKPDYDQAQTDLKLSRDLNALLSKADKETSARIKEDLEKQIDDAYNQGKTDGVFGGMFNIIKPLALMVAGIYLAPKLITGIQQLQRG